MEITIEVNDLTCFINGLNNAIIAYNDDTVAKDFCCHSNVKLQVTPVEECYKRLAELKYVYDQLLVKEKELC